VNIWLRPLILIMAALLTWGCTAGNPYMYTGAAIGTGVGTLGGLAIDRNNPARGAIIGGVIGGALGAVGGEAVRQRQQSTYQPPQGYYQPGYGPPPGYSAPPRYGYSAPPQGSPGYYSQGPSTPGPQNYSQAPSPSTPQYSMRQPPVNSYYYYPDSKSASDPNFGPD
jgi:hypothetical protein